MPKTFLFAILTATCLTASAQNDSIPAEISPFILPGYEPLDYKTGDLNGDKKLDAILILKQPGEDSLYGEETPRPMQLLIRQTDGKLKQVARNDNAIMCRHCGGVFGDPYEGTQIFDKGFSVSFYGGSSWRWAYYYEFRWNAVKKSWYLFKESQSSFQSGDPEATMKNIEIEASELGEVAIDKFNSDPAYEGSKWKVKAVKSFFYDNPKPGSKPRKGYLIKGNQVTGIRQLKNFIEVSFDNGKGVSTSGFILKKDLLKLQ